MLLVQRKQETTSKLTYCSLHCKWKSTPRAKWKARQRKGNIPHYPRTCTESMTRRARSSRTLTLPKMRLHEKRNDLVLSESKWPHWTLNQNKVLCSHYARFGTAFHLTRKSTSMKTAHLLHLVIAAPCCCYGALGFCNWALPAMTIIATNKSKDT